jgi:hypothetical protein
MGSHALGDPDLLRGCLFYGLLAAKKPLPEAGWSHCQKPSLIFCDLEMGKNPRKIQIYTDSHQ